MSLINELRAEHGDQLTGALTSELGLDQNQAESAIESVAPMILNGLKLQKDAGGTDAVSSLLSKFGGSENLLGNLGSLSGLLGNGNPLGALLGGSSAEDQATNAIGQKLGLDSGKAGSVIAMLTPVIMGFLAKKGREDSATPDTQSGISAILDRDGDGSALNDIAGMIFNKGGSGGGGMLGSIVGGLLGGKK